jgi:hypothetical protein
MIDERQRHELYRGVEELLGTERADTLMSRLPPVGWADVATKDDIRLVRADLRNLEERIDGRFAKVDARFDRVDARFDRVDARFEQVEARFEQVEARFDQVDARFDQVELKVQAMLHQSASELTRTLTFALLGALFTMTSLCLGAIAFTG